MAKRKALSRRGHGRPITVEEQKAGSRKCVAKAIQLVAVIDELQVKVPTHGWVDDTLDDLVRLLEVDPLSGVHRQPADALRTVVRAGDAQVHASSLGALLGNVN